MVKERIKISLEIEPDVSSGKVDLNTFYNSIAATIREEVGACEVFGSITTTETRTMNIKIISQQV